MSRFRFIITITCQAGKCIATEPKSEVDENCIYCNQHFSDIEDVEKLE